MSLSADAAVYVRRLRRAVTFWRLLAVAALVLLAISLIAETGSAPDGDHVARLYVENIIVDDPERTQMLRDIAEDDNARALLVHINSPGGTVVGGEALFKALRQVAENKPVVAVMGELATSGGYMAAIGADHIIARNGTITGSIGVIMQSAQVTGLLDKLGIEPQVIKSRPLKAQPNPLEPLTPAAREAVETLLLDMHAMFSDMVAERRGFDPAKTAEIADGRIYTGRQALELGLIDAIGGEPEALDWLANTHDIDTDLPLVDVEVPRPFDLWRELLGGPDGKALFSERLRLDGLLSLWHPGV